MSDLNFRRLVWGTILLFTALIWTLAAIGARSLTVDPGCPSVWAAAKTSMPVTR